VGKSHFALTAPEPIHVIDTEFGIAPLLLKEPFSSKDIRVFEAAQLSVETAELDPIQSIEAVEQAVAYLKDINTGTIVIDTVTDIWQWIGAWLETVATARTQSGRPYQFEWGKANIRYRRLILRLMAKPRVHVILTGQPRPLYDEQGRRLGSMEPRVQRQTEHMVDAVLYLEKRSYPGYVKYVATLTKCRFQRGFNTTIEDITFDRLVNVLETELGVVMPWYQSKNV